MAVTYSGATNHINHVFALTGLTSATPTDIQYAVSSVGDASVGLDVAEGGLVMVLGSTDDPPLAIAVSDITVTGATEIDERTVGESRIVLAYSTGLSAETGRALTVSGVKPYDQILAVSWA